MKSVVIDGGGYDYDDVMVTTPLTTSNTSFSMAQSVKVCFSGVFILSF